MEETIEHLETLVGEMFDELAALRVLAGLAQKEDPKQCVTSTPKIS